MCSLVFTNPIKRITMQISETPFLYCSFIYKALPCKFQTPQSLKLQCFSRQLREMIVNFWDFPSHAMIQKVPAGTKQEPS